MTMFAELSQFPIADPHGTFVAFSQQLLERGRALADPRGELHTMLFGGRDSMPGLGLEIEGGVMGDYDWEYMHELGIPRFARREAFLVYFQGWDFEFDNVLYSREEFQGWLSVALLQAADWKPERRDELVGAMKEYCRPEDLSTLRSRLDGESPWSHGPVGDKFTDEDLARWRAFHRPGFSERYLSDWGGWE